MKKNHFLTLLFGLLFSAVCSATDSSVIKASDSHLKNAILERFKSSGKVRLDLYVMSMCPYGVDAEKKIIPILREIKGQVNFTIYFIAAEEGDGFRSLHGDPEVFENRRQLVIQRHFPKKLLDYLLERSLNYSGNDWQKSALAAHLDPEVISTLVNRQVEIDAFRKNISNCNRKKIFGSPSLFINDILFKKSFTTTLDHADAKVCEGGFTPGSTCTGTNTIECPNACVGGLNDGKECKFGIPDCPNLCVGGPVANEVCTSSINCSGECVDGTNNKTICSNSSVCTGGGRCSNFGQCTDQGRCSNIGRCKDSFSAFLDQDFDGYWSQAMEVTTLPAGWTTNAGQGGGDCNDNDAAIHPGAPQPCGPDAPDTDCQEGTLPCDGANIVLDCNCAMDLVTVKWQINMDMYVKAFRLEKSSDGSNWQLAGDMPVEKLINKGSHYSFSNSLSESNINFYRLIAYQENGNKVYSALVASPCSSSQLLTVAPNPVNKIAKISLSSLKNEEIYITIVDSKGITVNSMKKNIYVGKNQFDIDLSNLSSGNFTLIARSNTISKSHKIIIR